MVVVYTDIDAAGDEEFTDYYGTADRPGVTSTISNGVLSLNEDEDIVSANSGLYSSPHFPKTGDQVVTYGTDERDFPGRFNGVPGEYSCTGATCRAIANSKGQLINLEGEWSFDADAPEAGKPHKVYGVTPDTDYMYFGYWVQTIPGEDGDPTTYKLQTFADGLLEYASIPNGLTGTAKYAGDAAGIYAWKQLRTDGSAQRIVAGEFTADVNLTAYFGGLDVAANDVNSIEGTITGFEAADADLSAWEVELEQETFTATGGNNGVVGFTGGTAKGGGNEGQWSANLFGDNEDDGNDPVQPSGIAGEFDAHFSNGHAAGAFGAERVKK
jgi:hypothetical protein